MKKILVSTLSVMSIFYSGLSQANIGGICCPFSDVELKNSVSKLTYTEALPLLSLEGKKYKWNDDGSQDIGFLAQDVEKVFPELVHEKEGHKTVDYDKLIAPMLVIIKNQQEQLGKLKNQLDALTSQK